MQEEFERDVRAGIELSSVKRRRCYRATQLASGHRSERRIPANPDQRWLPFDSAAEFQEARAEAEAEVLKLRCFGNLASSQIVASVACSAPKGNAVKQFPTADRQGATVTQAGGLIAISRWLSEATPPVPDAPNPTATTRRHKMRHGAAVERRPGKAVPGRAPRPERQRCEAILYEKDEVVRLLKGDPRLSWRRRCTSLFALSCFSRRQI